MERRRDTHPAKGRGWRWSNVQSLRIGSRCRDTAPFKMASSIGHCSNFLCPSLLFLLIAVCFSLGSFRFVSGLNPLSDLSLPSETTWVFISLFLSLSFNSLSFPPLWFDYTLFDLLRLFKRQLPSFCKSTRTRTKKQDMKNTVGLWRCKRTCSTSTTRNFLIPDQFCYYKFQTYWF